MARTINAEYVKRGDLFTIDPESIVVNLKENGRAFAVEDSTIRNAEFALLVESIERDGQMVPVEVRPTSTGPASRKRR
jgi:hypothetical protein